MPAGVCCIAASTNRMLLLRRSELVSRPLLWAFPAGGIDYGEDPVEAAFREFGEETGFWDELNFEDVVVYPSGRHQHQLPLPFDDAQDLFHCVVATSPREFKVDLNWENDLAGWFSFDELPSPLHPGVGTLLRLVGS